MIKSVLYDADGTKIRTVLKPTHIGFVGEVTFEFIGRVRGWEAGIYVVKVFFNDEEIHTQNFEV